MTRLSTDWLTHPLTRGLDVNDPQTTVLRRRIIQEKPFLRSIYQEWYATVAEELALGSEPVLEIGSGAGFMASYISNLVTSETFVSPNVDIVFNATRMPFADNTLRSIVMTDVLHHIPNVRDFFAEASRCVLSGGAIIMIEPWVTPWSRHIYARFHDEPFDPDASDWHFASNGPLSAANGALPWILFERDKADFMREFPLWQIKSIKPMMPFRYLLSGGVSMRSLMPGWSFKAWRFLENRLQPWIDFWAMFARIVLVKATTAELDEQQQSIPISS